MLRAKRQNARMSKITNDGYNPVWYNRVYPYGNSGRQRFRLALQYYVESFEQVLMR